MKRFFSDAAFTASSQLISALCAIAIQAYVARRVPLGDYGQYAAIQAYVLLIESIFVARGGEVALQYIGRFWCVDMPRAFWYRNHLVRLDWRMNIVIYAITIFFGFLFGSVFNFKWEWLILLALTIPAQIGYGVWKSIFIVDGKLKQQACFEISYAFILVTLALELTRWFGIKGLILATVFAAFLKTILAWQITRHYWPVDIIAAPPVGDPGVSLSHFRNANVHSIIRNAFMNGASQGDLLLVNALRGPEAAALYKVAKSIASIPIRAVTPAWVALRPRIMSSMRSQNIDHLHRLLILPAAFLAVIGIILAWPLVSYGEALIIFVFGTSYSSATLAALWLLLGTWIFGAISGWLSFACVISSRKLAGSLIYFIWLVGVVLGGLLWGKESPTSMPMVVASSMTMAALAGWLFFMQPRAWLNESWERTADAH